MLTAPPHSMQPSGRVNSEILSPALFSMEAVMPLHVTQQSAATRRGAAFRASLASRRAGEQPCSPYRPGGVCARVHTPTRRGEGRGLARRFHESGGSWVVEGGGDGDSGSGASPAPEEVARGG